MAFWEFLRQNARWLGAGMLLAFLSSFGQTVFISVFAGKIRAEYGLSDGNWGLIYTAATMASAATMVWAGGLIDRFRVRAFGTAVLLALALVCVAMAFNRTVWALPVVIFGLRFFGQGMAPHAAVVAMARWFVASRGRALAIAALGFALGEAILPLLSVALMRAADWRMVWLGAAVAVLLGVPLLRLLLQQERTPQSLSTESPSPGMGGRHWTRGEVVRQGMFWAVIPAVSAHPIFVSAFYFQQVHLAGVRGWDHLALVALFPLFPATSVASSFLFGWALDRVGATRLMGVYPLTLALAFVVLSVSDSLAGAALAIALMGVTSGGQATLPNAYWAEVYGTRHIGSIKSVVLAFVVLGSALGPGITGVLIDQGIAFPAQTGWIAAVIAASCVLCLVAVESGYRLRRK